MIGLRLGSQVEFKFLLKFRGKFHGRFRVRCNLQ